MNHTPQTTAARRAVPQMWSREAPPAPAGTVLSNPKGDRKSVV